MVEELRCHIGGCGPNSPQHAQVRTDRGAGGIVSLMPRQSFERAVMEAVLWRAMLDSDFNSRYWRYVTDKYSMLDFVLKIFLALAASGSVAAWSIWSEYPSFWKALSAAAAAASIASPLLAYGKKAEVAAAHAGLWADLRVRYADLWENYASSEKDDLVQKEHTRLRKIFTELEAKEPRLRIAQDFRAARRSQRDVLQARRLIQEQ